MAFKLLWYTLCYKLAIYQPNKKIPVISEYQNHFIFSFFDSKKLLVNYAIELGQTLHHHRMTAAANRGRYKR